MRIAGAILGALLVVALWANIAATLVIPRGSVTSVKMLDRLVDHLYVKAARHVRNWDRRDSLYASQPVVVLGGLLVLWLAGFILGFGLLGWSAGGSFPAAVREAASSMFTLGFAFRSSAGSTAIDCAAAASGLVVVALQIAYLPTLYSAYNRRETEVTLLRPRAGTPPWGPEILARAQITLGVDRLDTLFHTWERWSADVAESHASYPTLLRFRSPEPYCSWVTSQLAVMDAAALHLAACPSTATFPARLCLQMGFTSLRQVSRALRLPVEEDPRPDQPIELSFAEFLQGWQRLVEVGFPLERSAAEAWPHFRGWRVNYESTAYRLAFGLDLAPSRWTGPRRSGEPPVEPRLLVNRTPEHPEGSPFSPGTRNDSGTAPA